MNSIGIQIKIKYAYLEVPLPVKITGFHSPSREQYFRNLMHTRDSSLYSLGFVTSSIFIWVDRLKVLLSNPKSIVGDLPMTAGKDGVDVLETGDFLLMELRFDFVMLCFQSQGNELNHFRETSLRIEEVGFDVCM